MAGSRQEPRQATEDEGEALQAVYRQLAELLTTLRAARSRIRHPALLAVINEEIDRQLEADTALRKAMVDFTGRPAQDPY
jgi:nitrate/nitrite-specific signal transduction histidine kinase